MKPPHSPPQKPPSKVPPSKAPPAGQQSATPLTPLEALQAILIAQQPASLLVCSPQAIPGLSEYSNSSDCQTSYVDLGNEAHKLDALQRFDIAIVADTLEQLPKTAGRELLGRLHNLHSNSLCVLYSPEANSNPAGGSSASGRDTTNHWTAIDFFALGFKLAQRFQRQRIDPKDATQGSDLQMYTYAIESYNHRRDWNNNRFWANPENFGKYWW